ncbi:MAG: phospholipase D-like domain-containing protein [Acidimicrobiia bacterium]|nr:phospholipase D-like domain-containing protein [Acidimicrobiia bacterium]
MGTRTGGDLFIVDNSEDGWTGLRYLEEWTDIASSFDIATGYFDIGALLSLNGKWQKLDKIRILMGVETTSKTRAIILKSAQDKGVAVLNESLEDEKPGNPLLDGVTEIQEAIRSGRIEVRVYAKDKFHAKAYITHSSLNVIGSQALVGSSNFTKPGLSQNVELNLRIENSNDVDAAH